MGTKYDWSDVPAEVNWIAQDQDGYVYGYSIKPYVGAKQWYALKPTLIEQKYDGYWDDSLEQRPVEKN